MVKSISCHKKIVENRKKILCDKLFFLFFTVCFSFYDMNLA